MPVFMLDDKEAFPPAELANRDGLLAIGGDLSTERLLLAYRSGIFPWFSDDSPILWWSPDPRMVLFPGDFKVSKSLERTINKDVFDIAFDQDFDTVIDRCASVPRKDQSGTWITAGMIDAYKELHRMGYAHSVSAYYEGKMVGGLYGISIGKVFFGESMFHLMTDASKVAFSYLVKRLEGWNFDLIDAQQKTKHLRSFGAKAIPRREFLLILEDAVKKKSHTGTWGETRE